MTSKKPRVGPSMRVALQYIEAHPGVCTADVDRAVRTARGGHKWMYATVGRLIKAGLVRSVPDGSRGRLYAVPS